MTRGCFLAGQNIGQSIPPIVAGLGHKENRIYPRNRLDFLHINDTAYIKDQNQILICDSQLLQGLNLLFEEIILSRIKPAIRSLS